MKKKSKDNNKLHKTCEDLAHLMIVDIDNHKTTMLNLTGKVTNRKDKYYFTATITHIK